MSYQTKKLGEVATIKTGKLDANAAEDNGIYPFYTCSREISKINETVFDGESILIAGNGEFWVKYHERGKFNAYQRTYVIQAKDNVLTKYLFFNLTIQVPTLVSQGGVIQYLRLPQLKNLEIPLPPIAEQKKIVARSEGLLEKIKEAKRLRAEAQEAAQNLLPAELHKIFEEGKKKEWKNITVGDIANLMTGATPSTSRPEYYGGKIKWLVSGDIHKKEIFDCEGRITQKGMENSNAKFLPKDSLMIALNGQGKTKGTVAILRRTATCNQSLVAIIPNEQIIVEYLYYCLHFQYKKIRSMAGDDSRKGLNMKIVRKIDFLLPPLVEQKKIVARLDSLSEKIKNLREYQKSTASDLQNLEQSVLHQAFARKLV